MIREAEERASVEVNASGPLDNKGAARLRHILLHHIRSGKKHIVLDAGKVPYINSDGLRMLLAMQREDPDIRIDIKNANSHVIRTFALTNLDRIFRVIGAHRDLKTETV